jgi:cytochrome c-type biogenesis protein CcmH/NrfG
MHIALQILSAATLLLVLGACDSGASVEEHIARANQFVAGSEYDSATIELKNALQLDNQSAEARWLLGKVYLDSGDVLSAEKELQRALRLGWSHDDVVPALAETLLAQGKYSFRGPAIRMTTNYKG